MIREDSQLRCTSAITQQCMNGLSGELKREGRIEEGIMLVGKAWITQTYEEASAGVGDVCGEASVSFHRGS